MNMDYGNAMPEDKECMCGHMEGWTFHCTDDRYRVCSCEVEVCACCEDDLCECKFCEDCQTPINDHDQIDRYRDKCWECAKSKYEDDLLWAQEKHNYYHN